MTRRRETLIIIIGTIIGLAAIVSTYLWLQNYFFPPGMEQSIKAFEKKLNEPDPFWDHYRLARAYLEKKQYDFALRVGQEALKIAEDTVRQNSGTTNTSRLGMAHERLLNIYLAMGDIANAEKEFDWLDRDVREGGYWDKKVNAKETLGDIQMEYRRRLEELKKTQQQENSSSIRTQRGVE